MTPLPGAPEYIEGIVVHRRQVIGLLDLEVWFGRSKRVRASNDRILIIEEGALVAGIACDATTRMEVWPASILDAPVPDSIPAHVRPYVLALRDDKEQGTVLLLDVKRLLEDAAVKS